MRADDPTNTPTTPTENGRAPADATLETLLGFLKALADQSRLRLLGALAGGSRSVEELAATLDLKAPTVSHHLARLKALNLVAMRADGNTHLYWLNTPELERLAKLFGALSAPAALTSIVSNAASGQASDGPRDLFADVADPWERKVLRDFFDGERLREIPATAKKRLVIVKWLAGRFAWDRTYSETEVNAIIKPHHHDFAYLRRDMIGAKLMRRENGQYWRADPPTAETLDELATRFTWGKLYTEPEINAIIGASHRDITALRQELVTRNTLTSVRGKYWLTRPPENALDENAAAPEQE
jgi:DNA-binding transcriptional ArsR family regulator